MADALPPSLLQAQAESALAARDWPRAFALFAQAAQAEPTRPGLRLRQAEALGECGYFTSARRILDPLSKGAPSLPQKQAAEAVGRAWHRMGRSDRAEFPLRQAVDADGSPDAHECLARTLERLNRTAESLETAQAGLRKHPGHPGLRLAEARAHRRQGDAARAESVLRPLLEEPATAIEAGYELGSVLDLQERHAEAYAALLAAKRLQRPGAAPWQAAWRRQMAKLKDPEALPTAEDFRRWAAPAPAPQPVAFLVGCPRSGTTLLERALGAHPAVRVADEVPLFYGGTWLPFVRRHATEKRALDALRKASGAELSEGRRAYAAGMADALGENPGSRLLLDKNPSLFASVPALCRFFPEGRLVVARRDLRAIAWSCFAQYLPMNTESAAFLDLGDCLEHVETLTAHWETLRDRLALPWLEVRYEETVADFPGQLRRLAGFLGLPWDDAMAGFHRRQDAPARSPSYAQAAQPVHGRAVDRWRKYERFFPR